MMKYFGTNASVIQVSITASLLGLVVGQILMGALSDVYGRRKPLVMALIVYIIASFGCAFAAHINAIARDTNSGVELTKFMSLLSTIFSVAPLLAPRVSRSTRGQGSAIRRQE